MNENSFEVISHQLQQKTLPQKLRKLGITCLISEYVPHWQGPEPQGMEPIGAASVHYGEGLDSEGMTFWFFFPKGGTVEFDRNILHESVGYIFERIDRKSHCPQRSWTSIITLLGGPLGTN